MSPVQWALVAGRRVRPPCVAWAMLIVWAALVIGFGVAAGADQGTRTGLPTGRVSATLAAMATMGLISGCYLVPLALWAGWGRWRARRRRRARIAALKARRIVGGLGEVSGSAGSAGSVDTAGSAGAAGSACVGQMRLALPDGAPPLPLPGEYWLYWLVPTRRGASPLLLSAEPVDAQEAANRRAHPSPAQRALVRRVLADELGVTPERLAANRAGVLTHRQRRALVRRIRLRLLFPGVLIGALVAAGLGFFAVWGVLSLLRTHWADAFGAAVAFGIHGLAFAPPFVMMAWELVASSGLPAVVSALRASAPVERAEGETVVRLLGPLDEEWEICVAGDLRLPVSPMVGSALLAPGRYALYYLPGLGLLLSAEPLEAVADTAPGSPGADGAALGPPGADGAAPGSSGSSGPPDGDDPEISFATHSKKHPDLTGP
ncbi:hypothetical protein [Streptomyces sp. NBC_00878]|uniref:hypothetical protein n=1 Tax=Streptomyces sp. NBC_00878 TaxID=2975854 RepID=UPI0022517226|nr:hypothetical protein [Streptomyces sp. NBC_00878]MCX4905195.1 hypothetical protein [Streptomyces sp. NBC_00878]